MPFKREQILIMKIEALHWSLVNIAARLFGIMLLLAGLVFGLTALAQLYGLDLPTPGVSTLGNFLLSAFSLVFAVSFLTVRPYRPNVARQDSDTPGEHQPKLGWWTGTPAKNV